MNRRHALVIAVVGAVLAACGPSSEAPPLSDPREILAKTITATAPLKSVRIRVDAEAKSGPMEGGPPNGLQQGGWVEADVDLARQELSAHEGSTQGGDSFDVILVNSSLFVKNTSTGRWSKTSMPAGMGMNPVGFLGFGGMGGAAPDIPSILGAALADGSLAARLEGVEDCRTGRCYRTAVSIPPALVWQLVVKLSGIDRMRPGAVPQPGAGDVPIVNLELLTDTKQLWLVDGIASGAVKDGSATVRIQLGGHDEPVPIQAPPAALVDAAGPGFFGGGGMECVNPDGSPCAVIDHVGASLSPQP